MNETVLLFLLAAVLLTGGIYSMRSALKGAVSALSRTSKKRAQ